VKSVLTIMGTRPEAIKLIPVLRAINEKKGFQNQVCVTRQHTDLLDPYLCESGIHVDYKFEATDHGSTLHHNASKMLTQFGSVFQKSKPDVVIVQGDTTTAFIGALAAFYARIPVAHVEAGLRTGHLHSPWPEEAHRCLIDRLATYFFAPTTQAQQMLLKEGVSPEKIWVVGNTAIDAVRLYSCRSKPTENRSICPDAVKYREIMITVHRRENHGKPLEEICQALRIIAKLFLDVRLLFVMHPNPAIRIPVQELLSGVDNIELVNPLDHFSFLKRLEECAFVITDSGGIQEEAPIIGKPVLILRDTTERPECVEAGTARLIGTKKDAIVAACKELLENNDMLARMSKVHFPYGDGYAAERIADILDRELQLS
jgi:UDP-N-acetylglucosamine 2-epimerase